MKFYLVISYHESKVKTEEEEECFLMPEEREFYSNLSIDLKFQSPSNKTPQLARVNMNKPSLIDSNPRYRAELPSYLFAEDKMILSKIEEHSELKDIQKGVSVSQKTGWKPVFAKLESGDIIFEFTVPIGIPF